MKSFTRQHVLNTHFSQDIFPIGNKAKPMHSHSASSVSSSAPSTVKFFTCQWRRGNALVLVSAMLVLLVLIATAYLSRTQSQRGTAAAMQDASGDDRRVDMIKKQLASEIAKHLFVKPIDPTSSATYIGGDSAGNRIAPSMYSVRYGVESATKATIATGKPQPQGDQLSSIVDPSNPSLLTQGADGFPDGFNFAPYSVIPWTNWPDFITPTIVPSTGTSVTPNFIVAGEPNGNPLGNPGFGDTRWLRSTEPVRMNKVGVAAPDGDRFSHWPHLSWLPTPANGFRLVKDISDIEGLDTNVPPNPNILTGAMNQATNDAFGTPYEQWLPDVVPAAIAGAGLDPLADNTNWSTAFIKRRNNWFTQAGYQKAIGVGLQVTGPSEIDTLPNFIKLDDPLGVGLKGRTLSPEAQGVSKSEEWVDMTPRNVVSRTFCDTDGDGFTDSFWFLAPVGKERNVRTVVGVSVVDNASMVDVNVATRADRRTTVGFTPSDLALVTSEPEGSPDDKAPSSLTPTDTMVGLFDNPYNQTLNSFFSPFDMDGYSSPPNFRVQFDPYRWAGKPTYYSPDLSGIKTGLHDVGQTSFLQALGLRSTAGTWNNYFYGQPAPTTNATLASATWPITNTKIEPPTNEPFAGDMRDMYVSNYWISSTSFMQLIQPDNGPSGPTRPNQENPQYRFSDSSPLSFRAALPNQPFVRPSERTRWFRSAATGQGTLFAGSLTGFVSDFEQATLPNPSGNAADTPVPNLFGIPVPTRRFDASDELELRANAGNNDPSSISRLERSLNADDTVRDSNFKIADTILRSTVLRGEAGGGQEQLTSPQLVKDLRRKITVVSGQRNEIMPPWLWIGRPYGIPSPNFRETFQNSMLWLGLHPESPGPRDEDGNGRIDIGSNGNSELGYGKLDLYRIATSADAFQDGNASADLSLNTQIDGRDFNRAVRYFEEMNSKLDLRKPLLVTYDWKSNNTGALGSDGVPDRTPDGALDQFMAMSVNEQRLAMQDFVRETRGRLRAALRMHSPMTTLASKAFGLLTTEVLGINDTFADYTDRFYEHFLFTLNAQTKLAAANTLGTRVSAPTLGSLATPPLDKKANDLIAYRSAWSTEALTASMSANIVSWRSRADMMLATSATTGLADATLALRAVHQPILPDPSALLNPYEQTNLTPLAMRAVDPSKTTSAFDNNNFTPGSDPNAAKPPTDKTADIVFPGIEKHPFFTEVFFGWVYPATTTDLNNVIYQGRYNFCECPKPTTTTPASKSVEPYKFIAVVNGKVGDLSNATTKGVAQWWDFNKPSYPSTKDPNIQDDYASAIDAKRNTLNEIRTPVMVVQVANPWNEPLRLGDFRINIFGTDYDFPDYELDSTGTVITDKNGNPVPLMLAPATETEPATATVYLIANVMGNPNNVSNYDEYDTSHPGSNIEICNSTEGDLTRVASWDPLFRRRWLDYFDLYEYSDAPIVTKDSWFANGTATKLPTSPAASPLFPFSMKDAPPELTPIQTDYAKRLPRSKLINAMQPIKGKKTICDTNGDGAIDDTGGSIYDKPELTFEENPNFPDPTSSAFKLRYPTLQRFKDSLTRQNLARGITLQRVLKNPAALSGTTPILQDTNNKDVVLEVDRFDAHSDFDHWTTSGTAANSATPPVPMFADDRNFDTNLVTGGRFWTAAARITLPPNNAWALGATRTDMIDLLGAVPDGKDGKSMTGDPTISPNKFDYSFNGPGASVSFFPPPTAKPFVRDLNDQFIARNTPDPDPDCNCGGSPTVTSVNEASEKIPPTDTSKHTAYFPGIILGELDQAIPSPQSRPKGDYFTTWTHVSRTWSRLFDAKFVTVKAEPIAPIRAFTSTDVQASVTSNLPVWDYTRQLVTDSSVTPAVSSFSSNPISVDPTTVPPAPITSRSPMIPVERFAPRFVFANRTEPEFSNRPLDIAAPELNLQPTRVELNGVVLNRKASIMQPSPMPGRPSSAIKPDLAKRARAGTVRSDISSNLINILTGKNDEPVASLLHSQGDVFSIGKFLTQKDIFESDPDEWHPNYDITKPTPFTPDPALEWLRDGVSKSGGGGIVYYKMLLTPVWAPLPDFCGLVPPVLTSTPQDDVVPLAQSPWPSTPVPSWPTLVLRKPTSFNCQTVIRNKVPNFYPNTVDNPLPAHVVAFYGNGRLNVAQQANTLPIVENDTKFVTPLWSVPAGSTPVPDPSDGSPNPTDKTKITFELDSNDPKFRTFRAFMGDKCARLLDEDGLLYPIDLATGGQPMITVVPGTPPVSKPWLARGMWNTLDRIPQEKSFQMLQKDDDFEQIGELLDVFTWGPAYRIDNVSNALAATNVAATLVPDKTATPDPDIADPPAAPIIRAVVPNAQAKATFSEIMSNRVPGFPVGEGPFINRIQVDPLNVAFYQHPNPNPVPLTSVSDPYQFGGTSALRTPYAPNVPWGMRIFDCFTVDGAGAALRFDWTNPDLAENIVPTDHGPPLNTVTNLPRNWIEVGGSTLITPPPPAVPVVARDCNEVVPDIRRVDANGNDFYVSVNRPAGAFVPVDVYRNPKTVVPTKPIGDVSAQTLAQWEYDRSPSLSGNFAGLPTKGLLNINTASLEVMKTLPHMTEMVYEDTGRFDGPGTLAKQIPEPGSQGGNRYVRAPLAIEIYRNQLNPNIDPANPAAPNWNPKDMDPMSFMILPNETAPMYPTYVDRGEAIIVAPATKPSKIILPLEKVAYNTGMQSQRGISTIGEVIGIVRGADEMSWTMHTAGENPYQKTPTQGWASRDDQATSTDLDPLDARISTDRQGIRQFDFINDTDPATSKPKYAITDRQVLTYDKSYGDSEELNLLFKGISNLVTTRSDVFTVYFKVRTVKQNPIDGKWNGTDRESVLDDARYVMCVDRSNVNRPSDEPRIVYFSRVPD